jgi:hypothetical protein
MQRLCSQRTEVGSVDDPLHLHTGSAEQAAGKLELISFSRDAETGRGLDAFCSIVRRSPFVA